MVTERTFSSPVSYSSKGKIMENKKTELAKDVKNWCQNRDLENIGVDEVTDTYFEDDKLIIEYTKKELFFRIMDSDITQMIITFGSLIIGAIAIGYALIGKG